MKKTVIICLAFTLCGFSSQIKFDSSSETSIKQSTKEIVDSLEGNNRKEFEMALLYFSVGGKSGFKEMMEAALAGDSKDNINKEVLANNLKSIDGLTAEQILEKYRLSLGNNRPENDVEESPSPSISDNQNKEINKSHLTKSIDKDNYIRNVEITEFVAKRIDTYLEKDVPAIRISLKNNGNRSLDKVKVVVYFKDSNGNTIYEEYFHPVLVNQYSYRGDNKPLKSGYIKEMEKGRYYTLKSALSDWQEGNAIAEIVDIDFTP